MKLTAYSYTNRGGRGHNEDSLLFHVEDCRGVFVLADGLGGHRCGEVASALAVQSICQGCLDEEQWTDETILGQLHATNEALLTAQKTPGQEEMRTTAVVLCLEDQNALWGHIGDSRLYHLTDGALTQLTADHSVTYQKYLGGEIGYMDIYHDDDRSSLLRVLGKPACKPVAGAGIVKPGDAFLLCSDGFWEYVYQEEILTDWLKSETPEQWVQRMLLRHIRRTPPENDNFSLIAVFVEE